MTSYGLGENICKPFANLTRHISITYKEFSKSNIEETNNPSRKQPKDIKRHFIKEDIWRANKHMRICSTSIDKHILKLIWKGTASRIAKPVLTKKNKVGESL